MKVRLDCKAMRFVLIHELELIDVSLARFIWVGTRGKEPVTDPFAFL